MQNKFLKKKIFGKSTGEWIHYPIVLSVVLGLTYILKDLGNWKNWFIILVVFIIADSIAENYLIKNG